VVGGVVGRLLGGREAGLSQLLCRQNEGECIWDVKGFRKVVEVNRGSASSVVVSVYDVGPRILSSQQSKIDVMPLGMKIKEPT
jgi:hypothetical protein